MIPNMLMAMLQKDLIRCKVSVGNLAQLGGLGTRGEGGTRSVGVSVVGYVLNLVRMGASFVRGLKPLAVTDKFNIVLEVKFLHLKLYPVQFME